MYFDYFHSQFFPPKSLNILPPTPNFMYCFFFFSDPPSTICVVRIMGVKLFIYQGTQPLKKKNWLPFTEKSSIVIAPRLEWRLMSPSIPLSNVSRLYLDRSYVGNYSWTVKSSPQDFTHAIHQAHDLCWSMISSQSPSHSGVHITLMF